VSEVFGGEYARAYDAIYRQKDYEAECDLLEKIFKDYAAGPVRDILDLGCGTGNHALRLASRGYRVTGVDISAGMLAVARDKAKQEKLDVAFHEADIRDFRMEQPCDAVLMMFAVLGYQIENADVLAALRTARRHLRPGGLLAADFWYGPAVLTQRPEERALSTNDGDVDIVRKASAELDARRHVCTVRFNLRRSRGNKVISETEEEHRMRFFFPKELELFLEASGFRLARLGAFPEFHREPDESTWNAMLAAAAVGLT
jgi:SAM-dependent methyltransferase